MRKITDPMETIIKTRLIAIKHTEPIQVYRRQWRETTALLEKINDGSLNYREIDGYLYFFDAEETITNIVKKLPLEETDKFSEISRPKKLNLYRCNFGSKNELIFRSHGKEEKERLKYLPSGFYYITDKIDSQAKYLYYVSNNPVEGEFIHHKTINGKVCAFSEPKNNGKIYRINDYNNLLKDENKKFSEDHLIYSAYVSDNDAVFEKIMRLYVPVGNTVADISYGKGIFWKKIDKRHYRLSSTDIAKDGIDCRNLPYANCSFDACVFDPPFVFDRFGGSSILGKGSNFEKMYRNEESWKDKLLTNERGYEALLRLYFDTSEEVFRVLKQNGIFIVKCQDWFTDGKQRIIHCEIINELSKRGWKIEDIFVVVAKRKPVVNHLHQIHARKNHSYFLIFRKTKSSLD